MLLRQALPRLQATYPIRSLALVGSYARGEQTPQSDVDLLIDIAPTIGWDLALVHQELETLLGLPVDLIEVGGLRPWWHDILVPGARHV